MLTIIANLSIESSRLEEIKSAMLTLVDQTLEEPGCIRYELHQDDQQPTQFTFVENWHSRPLWRAHMEGMAVKAFNKSAAGGIIDIELQEMTRLA